MSTNGEASEMSIVLGLLLIVIGLAAYVFSDFASVTALIPAVFGILIVGLGILSRTGSYRHQALYAIGALALFGVLGSLRAVPELLSQEITVGTVSQGLMILVSLVLLGIVVRALRDGNEA